MGNKMLIDATHPEETRVVVLRGHRVEEFDYESASKKQLRGNIYLAKVTRVEPSLQAAFVNYGGNRHGFLAFNEIHPDYYQLPMAERQALKQEEERDSQAAAHDDDPVHAAEGGAHDDEHGEAHEPLEAVTAGEIAAIEAIDHETVGAANGDAGHFAEEDLDPVQVTAALEAALPATRYSAEVYDDNGAEAPEAERNNVIEIGSADSDAVLDLSAEDDDDEDEDDEPAPKEHGGKRARRHNGNGDDLDHVESVGSEDALEELPQRNRRRRRIYKIQEVIKRGQIMLVQVVKEERGNKGAALTTYMSLAGRYTVLMPNTGSGGGISRKISSASDRKRLREIATELDVSDGMGLIIRTAGAARTKTEIKRDYEYLLRLWENVRELTLKSTAPALVYEEGDLIKRSIRDLYSRDIDEVLVAGDDAYRDAKDFMRMLMPSHAKNVQPYKEPEPLFTRNEVERQLNAMFSPQVTLPSGGYIIINQTEALVAIDVNSGKATREFSIEDTALNTNMEAAEEIARQLRLRDLAGLIVVDFIDMEEKRNNRSVERKLKECLRNDRARIQVGRISHFGLLEMSRQRLRTGMVEGSTSPCQHCQGTGMVRSTESVSLSVLRSLEDWLRTNNPCNLNAVCSSEVALYILNQKRNYLQDIETRHGVIINITASDRMHGANFYIEKVSIAAAHGEKGSAAVTQSDRIIQPFEGESGETGDDKDRRNRRRRRRRRGRGDEPESRESFARAPRHEAVRHETVAHHDEEDEVETIAEAPESSERREPRADAEGGQDDGQGRRRSRRRGRRGGRHHRTRGAEGTQGEHIEGDGEHGEGEAYAATEPAEDQAAFETPLAAEPAGTAAPSQPYYHEPAPVEAEAAVEAQPVAKPEAEEEDTRSFRKPDDHGEGHGGNGIGKPNGRDHSDAAVESGGEDLEPADTVDAEIDEPAAPSAPPKPRGNKRGWWQKRA
jgi:ribonuclease E